jgi:hypothetical protein
MTSLSTPLLKEDRGYELGLEKGFFSKNNKNYLLFVPPSQD